MKALDMRIRSDYIDTSTYGEITHKTMFDFLRIAKALADENRLRALMALDGRELCVCQIIELLELAPSTVSKHMSILRQVRLVSGRKRGRWMYYRLAGPDASAEVKAAIAWVRTSLDASVTVRQDASRLEQILDTHKEELCQKYHKR